MALHVNVTPRLESLVKRDVASGLYGSASEVVREGVRLMAERDHHEVIALGALRRDIREGLASQASSPWDLGEIKRGRRARRVTATDEVPWRALLLHSLRRCGQAFWPSSRQAPKSPGRMVRAVAPNRVRRAGAA